MTQKIIEKEGFWSGGLGIALKCYIIIYGVTIIWNFVLNAWMRAAPIGPDKLYWFDNICWMLFALYWGFLFMAVGNWPFSKMKGKWAPGIVAVIVSWILGYITYTLVYAFGVTIDGVFPIVGALYFVLIFFAFTGENWPWADLSPGRQFFLILITVLGLTWLLCRLGFVWVPAWWFPMLQILLGTTLFGYLFRRMKQPIKGIIIWCLMWVMVWAYIYISELAGIWDPAGAGIGSPFWNIGVGNDFWLLHFFVFCSFVFGILVPARNWPFRLVRMPWGGILGGLFCVALTIGVTALLLAMVNGGVLAEIQEAQTYGYMGVCWSFMILLFFPALGHFKPYLWAGQKTPGTWEDVD